MDNLASLGYIAAILVGAGATELKSDVKLGLILLGSAAVLIIIKAIMNRFGVPIGKKD